MNDPTDHSPWDPSPKQVHRGLRAWGKGLYGTEAAVELLIRALDGRFAHPGWPWIKQSDRPGQYWLDAEAIQPGAGALSGGEQRVLALAAALAGSQMADRRLADIISGVDRSNQALILAALSHAGGSHQHSNFQRHEDGSYAITDAGPLFPWPKSGRAAEVQDGLPLQMTSQLERPRHPREATATTSPHSAARSR